MSFVTTQQSPQHPAYGLRSRCSGLWVTFRKCMIVTPNPFEDCKELSQDYMECVLKLNQRTWDAKLEKAIIRQREKFRDEVEKEEQKMNISYFSRMKDKYL